MCGLTQVGRKGQGVAGQTVSRLCRWEGRVIE